MGVPILVPAVYSRFFFFWPCPAPAENGPPQNRGKPDTPLPVALPVARFAHPLQAGMHIVEAAPDILSVQKLTLPPFISFSLFFSRPSVPKSP
jgi:hypothetical protein